jgi:hypothetical protein
MSVVETTWVWTTEQLVLDARARAHAITATGGR